MVEIPTAREVGSTSSSKFVENLLEHTKLDPSRGVAVVSELPTPSIKDSIVDPVPDPEQPNTSHLIEPNSKLDYVHSAAQQGYIPNLIESTRYATSLIKEAFPSTPEYQGKSTELSVAQTWGRTLETWQQTDSQKTDTASEPSTAIAARQLCRQYAENIKPHLEQQLAEHKFSQDPITNQSAIAVDDPLIEIKILERHLNQPQINPAELQTMTLLTLYRSCRLADELLTSSLDNHPLDKEVIKNIWQADNIRRATSSQVS